MKRLLQIIYAVFAIIVIQIVFTAIHSLREESSIGTDNIGNEEKFWVFNDKG